MSNDNDDDNGLHTAERIYPNKWGLIYCVYAIEVERARNVWHRGNIVIVYT